MTSVALIGNPNCGKTTVFNYFTRSNQEVGNRAGVTVEKKEGLCTFDKSVKLIDLPGIYSLNPFSLEESVVKNYLIQESPDVIINVLDVTNLKKGLFLTTQLLEFCPRLILVLNMCDELEEGGASRIVARLTETLDAPVIDISAVKGTNMDKIEKLLTDNDFLTPPCERRYVRFLPEDEREISKLPFSRFESIERYVKNPEGRKRITAQRYSYIDGVLAPLPDNKNKKILLTEKLDRIFFNRFTAFPIFFLVLFIIFYLSVQVTGRLFRQGTEAVLLLCKTGAAEFLFSKDVSPILVGLISDGIIAGVGSVLTFLPQIAILFTLITVLEGCGYMARMAVLTDRIFKNIGLSGKALLPLLIGCGCTVPGILSTNALENPKEKEVVLMVTPFVPCSAKLPVFALLGGSFFPENPFIAPSMYIIGILTALFYSFIFNFQESRRAEKDGFFYELPYIRLPPLKSIFTQVIKKLQGFLLRTGTTVFLASVLLWFLSNFDISFHSARSIDTSILASLGRFLAPVFAPLGFGNYQSVSALLAGFFGKETIITALAVILKNPADIAGLLTPGGGYAFMVFILLSSPCIAALSALRRELGTKKLIFLMILQQLTAYFAAFIAFLTLS